MKKIKIEERLENAVNAFFETNADKNAEALVFADGSAVLRNAESASFTEKAEFWTNAARQVFLFLPGAFLLYLTTLASVFFYSDLGLTPQMLFLIPASGFFCWVGLGSLKNKKNLLVPSSIFLGAALLGILFSFFPNAAQPALYFNYSIYFFPPVLIISKLLQSRIEDE